MPDGIIAYRGRSAASQIVQVHQDCLVIDNLSSSDEDYFVPVRTLSEWLAFKSNRPSSLQLIGACPPRSIDVCGTTQTLPTRIATEADLTATLTAGNDKSMTFRCTATANWSGGCGVWLQVAESGGCNVPEPLPLPPEPSGDEDPPLTSGTSIPLPRDDSEDSVAENTYDVSYGGGSHGGGSVHDGGYDSNGNYTGSGGYTSTGAPANSMSGQQVGGGSSGGGGASRVVCTHLFSIGRMPADLYSADVTFTERHIASAVVRGYHFWAVPLVKAMRRHPLLIDVIEPLAMARAHEIGYLMGIRQSGSLLGWCLRFVGEPICHVIGCLVANQDWQRLYDARPNTQETT